MTVHINIGSTDYGPHGENVVQVLSFTKGTGSRNGQATLALVFDYAFAYDIHAFQEVQVYDLVGGTANGIFGGFVMSVDSGAWKGTVKRLVTIKCVDYNFEWDAINLRLASPLTISAATLPTQLTALFHGFQWQGAGSVSKDFDSATYVTNITGGTVLPQLVIPGGTTFRQGMRSLMANVQVANSALRPRYGLTLESDGAGGVQAALMLVDGAATPTPVADFAQVPTGGQRSIFDFKRTLDSSMPMVNARQSRWHTAFGEQYASYTNPTSGGIYPNPYVNNGLPGGKGYWSDVPLDDKDSQNSTDAANKLAQLVQTVEYPRESTTLTYDKLPAETLFIRVGQAVTVTWPPDQLVAASYVVTSVSIAFPVSSKESYERVTLTLGLPRLELGEDGTDGLTGAPHEITWSPIPPTGLAIDTSYGTNGYTWQGQHFATAGFSWTAPPGRQPQYYQLHLHETSPGSHDVYMAVPGDSLTAHVPSLEVGATYTPTIIAGFPGAQSEPCTGSDITVPEEAPDPPTALAVDTAWTWGILGYLYDGHGGAWARLAFTPPAELPTWYISQVLIDTTVVYEHRIPGTYTGVTTNLLVVGNTYEYRVYSETEHGVRSLTYASLGPQIVPASPTEKLTNPGFEFVGAGATGTIRGWSATKVVGGVVGLDGTNKHSGASALSLATSSGGGSLAQVQSDLVVVKGATYALKIWAKKTGLLAMSLKWTYTWYDTDGTTSLGTSTGTLGPLTSSFALYSATATAAAGAAYYRLTLEPSGLSQTIYADDVSSDPQAINADVGAGAVGFSQLAGAVVGSIPGGSLGTGLIVETNDALTEVTNTNKIFVPNGSLTDFGSGVVGVAVPSGTAFPATPDGPFYRTDLGVLCYHDGTRWLGPEITVDLFPFNGVQTLSATTVSWVFKAPPGSFQYLVTYISWWFDLVSVGSTATNYFTATVGYQSNGFFGSIGTVTSQGVTSGTHRQNGNNPGAGSNNPPDFSDATSNAYQWRVDVTKVGSPTNIAIAGVSATVRRVYT